MLTFILKRLLSVIPVFICISIMLFAIIKAMPGDPVRLMLPNNLKAEQYDAAYRVQYRKMGLDKSLPEQYLRWMGNMFKGDFSHSSKYNRPVSDILWEPMRNTLYLNFYVLILEVAIMIPIGIQMARKRGSVFDSGWQVFSLITYSMPSFFIALSLIYIFSIRLSWLPFGGMPNRSLLSGFDYMIQWFRHAALPMVTLTIINIAYGLRYVRNAMIESLGQDYIRTARAKGLSEGKVVYSHAFRNALIPVSTIIIFSVFSVFIGSPITETVFAWNGIGRVLVEALSGRDFALVMTVNWIFAICAVIGNLVADIAYGLIDPRIKLG